MDPRNLTIVLTLRGRNFHTLRWIWHANRIRLPFHVVIADGEVHPIIANIMDNPSNFPDLSFEYHRYEDKSFSDYYRKRADATSKVLTPYVMMVDNDDFLVPSGIFKSLNFLDKNPDYVCHSGKIGFFFITGDNKTLPPNLVGPFYSLGTRYHFCDYAQESATQRVQSAARKYWPTSYNVYRTDRLRLINDELVSFDFSDIVIFEMFCAFRAVTLGKLGIDWSVMSYLRQDGTSSGYQGEMDFVQRVVSTGFMLDFQAMALCLANASTNADVADEEETDKMLRGAYADFFRLRMTDHEEKLTFKSAISRLLPEWLFKIRSQYFPPIRAQRRNFVERLKQAGASRDYLNSFGLELRQIEETLEGQGFLDFMHSTVGKDLSVLY